MKNLIIILCLIQTVALAQPTADTNPWWTLRYDVPSGTDQTKSILPLISVSGNKFVDASGNTVVFKGINVSDPDKLEHQGQWKKKLFIELKSWGVDLVRLPIHPSTWNRRGEDYLRLLDEGINWCSELGIYVILDWHSIGNLEAGLFEHPMYFTSLVQTRNFWKVIAERYAGHHTVAFYEIFNEPTVHRGKLGRASWDRWRQINEEIIFLIRAYDEETIPLVAGFDWAYDLTPLQDNPLNVSGIAYVTHPYPHKRNPPYEEKWDENFGFAANKYPLIATEFGFTLGDYGLAENGEYGERIVKYFEDRGISWMAWVFDPDWFPQMLKSWDKYETTEYGQFIKDQLKQR